MMRKFELEKIATKLFFEIKKYEQETEEKIQFTLDHLIETWLAKFTDNNIDRHHPEFHIICHEIMHLFQVNNSNPNWNFIELFIPYVDDPEIKGNLLLLALRVNTSEANAVAETLIANDANVNTESFYDYRVNYAIHLAIANNNIKIVLLLLPKADLDLRNAQDRTPFELAVYLGYWEMAELLFNTKRPNQTILDYSLGVAAITNNEKSTKFMKLLLAAGADGSKQYHLLDSTDMKSALHVAAENGNAVMLKTLFKYKTNPNVKTSAGLTSFEILKNLAKTKSENVKKLETFETVLNQARIYHKEKENLYWVMRGFLETTPYLHSLPSDVFNLILEYVLQPAIDFYKNDISENSQQSLTAFQLTQFHHSLYCTLFANKRTQLQQDNNNNENECESLNSPAKGTQLSN